MSAKIVRLVTGEELIAKCEATPSGYIVKDPVIIVPIAQGKIGFAKWLPYAKTDDGVNLSSSHVMFVLDADVEMENQYTSMISGIVLPGAQGSAPPQFRISGAD